MRRSYAPSTDRMPLGVGAPPDRRWLALVVIALAQLMVALDATIVNIALPSAQADLGFADADRQWVITAYTLAFGGLLLLGGRVADHIGRRHAFLAGLVGFAVSSAIAGAAAGFPMLVTGRALQGAFAALLTPTALSMVAVTFTEPKERARAFGVYGAVASSGGALGLLLGGALTGYLDWRWCLYVNVAIAAVALVVGRVVLPTPAVFARPTIDLVAGALITGGLVAVVYGCSQAVQHGWTSGRVAAPLVAGVALSCLFLVRQGRTASPLLPLHILTSRARAGAYLSVAAAVVGSFGVFLMLTYYFQVVLQYSPLRTGLAFLPLSAAVSFSAYGLGSHLLPRVPPRVLIGPGLLVAAAALALLTRLDPSSGYLTLILPVQVLLGAGIGCVFTPAISVATTGVQPTDAGIAAAAASTAMQVGGSIGTAVLNTIAITATGAYLSSHAHSAAAGTAALIDGYAAATGWAAALLAVVAVVAFMLIRFPQPQNAPSTPTNREELSCRS
jgi:EmrB/QacA subfamily drug resistance transporter